MPDVGTRRGHKRAEHTALLKVRLSPLLLARLDAEVQRQERDRSAVLRDLLRTLPDVDTVVDTEELDTWAAPAATSRPAPPPEPPPAAVRPAPVREVPPRPVRANYPHGDGGQLKFDATLRAWERAYGGSR